jgi:transposase
METIPYEYETKRLDHLGIVAGICKQINLVTIIDESLPTPSDRKVSCGQATLAMVLNALGLTGRALYLMPDYMHNKPVDLLFGEGLVATDFNDDSLGRALDELFQAGVTELFARVAAEAVDVFKIEHKYVHVDTSSLSLQGQYESKVAKEAVEKREAVQITYGYSKDKRPDLKQVVVTLITSQASALPLWLEVLDGNSHDTNSFVSTVENYCQQLTGAKEPWFIMDSASYSKENLSQWGETRWLTRVPETSTGAKEVVRCVPTHEMEAVGDGYHIYPIGSIYGGVKQRWLLVYSQQAYEREGKQLDKQVQRAYEAAEKTLHQLAHTQFACETDAQHALNQQQAALKWHHINSEIVPIKKYARPGRPAKGAVPAIVGWRVQGELVEKQAKIAQARQWKGRFVLATNELETEALPDLEMLSAYKTQAASVERGFRFLKDPMFFADSLFLKSPARIMAMIMVMGLALLVYALAERELRRQLQLQNETVPHQTGKPTQAITMRRVAQIFEGIDLLVIRAGPTVVARKILNLSPLRLKIIRLLGPEVQSCYLLPP